MNAGEIKRLLADRADKVAEYLLKDGKRKGKEWVAGNVRGEAGTSLSVRITGDRAGVWSDFASGEAGDLLDLWMANRGLTLVEAIKDAKAYLGIRDEAIKPPERTYRAPERPKCQTPKGSVADFLRLRHLNDETIKAFKIGEQLRGGKAYCVFPFLLANGDLVNVKYRNIEDKKDQRQEKDAAPCLMGWHLISPNARQVIICEGEIDAMSIHQCGLPALSVNQGAGNHQWIETDWNRLDQFDDILVCFDNDEPGDKGAEEVIRRLGIERCRRMRVGAKDANQWLQEGAEHADFWHAIQEARSIDPEELRNANDYTSAVERIFYPEPGDRPAPYLKFDTHCDWFQFRGGEYTCWTGINGHGKSLMLDQVLLGLMEQGERVVVFSGEMPPARHLERVHRQATGVGKPTREYIRAVGNWLSGKCWMFDLVGNAKVDRLLEVFSYAARRYGATHFVIDSLMMTDVPQDGPSAITKQNEAVQKLTGFAKTFNVHLHLVAHPRKGKDESSEPGKMDVAGAGGIVNGADNVFSVWRADKDEAPANPNDPQAVAEWEKQRSDIDAKLVLKKSRYGEFQSYTLKLWFDKPSMQYRMQPRRFALRYVEYSNQDFTGDE